MESQLMNERVDAILAAPLENRRELFSSLFSEVISESGVSLQGISHQTRISINFLEALLKAEFEVLPGEIFGRGFIRNVCKIIDMDPRPLVNAYDACLDAKGDAEEKTSRHAAKKKESSKAKTIKKQAAPKIAKKEVKKAAKKAVPSTAEKKSSEKNSSNRKEAAPRSFGWLFPVVGVAAAVMVALWPTKNEEQNNSNLPFAVKAMKSASVKRPAEIVEKPETVVNVSPETQTEASELASHKEVSHNSFKAESAGFEQVVEIKVLEPVKIKKTIDQGETEVEELSQKTYRFVFDDEAEFLVYDASAVQITFNGRPIGRLGDKGRIRRISFAKKAENQQSF